MELYEKRCVYARIFRTDTAVFRQVISANYASAEKPWMNSIQQRLSAGSKR